MTTKPKTRKAPPAAKAMPKAAPQPNGASEAEKLIARWDFLMADGGYKASIAATEEESETCFQMHAHELDKIATRLAELRPNNLYAVLKLLWFVVRETKDGDFRCDDLELKIIRNVTAALPELHREEQERVHKETMTKLRDEMKWSFRTLVEIQERERRTDF